MKVRTMIKPQQTTDQNNMYLILIILIYKKETFSQ